MSSFVMLLSAILAVTLYLSLCCDSLNISAVTLVFLACREFFKNCVTCVILIFDAPLLLPAVYPVLASALAHRLVWTLISNYCRSITPPVLIAPPGLRDNKIFQVVVLIISTLTLLLAQLLIACLYVGFRLFIFAIRCILVPIAGLVAALLLSALSPITFTLSRRVRLALISTPLNTAVRYLSLAKYPVLAPHCLAALAGITARVDKTEALTDDLPDEMDLDLDLPSPTSASSSLEDSDMDTSEDFDSTDSSATSPSAPSTPTSGADDLDAEEDLADAEEEFADAHEDFPEEEYRFVDDDVEMQPVEPENTATAGVGSSEPSIGAEAPTGEKRKGKAVAKEPLDPKSLATFAFTFKSSGPAYPPRPPAFRLTVLTEPPSSNPLMSEGPREPFVMPTLPTGPISWSKP